MRVRLGDLANGPRATTGFTLIELVIVIVLLSILALGTTRYIIRSVEQYTVSADRTRLIAEGRVALEKVVRRLRNALPNSIRVSASGRCIEYFPVLTAASTVGSIAVPTSTLTTSNFTLGSAPANYAVIATLTAAEVYAGGSPGVRAQTSIAASGSYSSIGLSAPHAFVRTSPTERVYLVTNPERICVSAAGALNHYSGYGILAAINDTPPGGASALIATNLDLSGGLIPFLYTPGTMVRNALVEITLNFIKNNDPVRMSHKVQIRNVP